jgi:hypothetical protein
MVDNTSLTNLALQAFGNRTIITAAQLAAGSNNEAKQSNLVFSNVRNTLLRMAPWDCGLKTANLTYITSLPGTPENTSAATNLWQPGQPRPPFAYEYQYPVDCLRACWIIPAQQTGDSSSVPITTAVTGGAPTTWNVGPMVFKVGIDEFFCATAAAVVAGGTGYAAGDLIVTELSTLSAEITNRLGTFNASQPQGAAVVLRVLTLSGSAVATVEVVSVLPDSSTPYGGSLFYTPTQAGSATVAQDTTTGAGTGATFTFTIDTTTPRKQRVILTNQEYATLAYVAEVTDPNVWDPLFQDAFVNALAADMCMALSGDKTLANRCVSLANAAIEKARAADGNEGLTQNNVTPDWIRGRGIAWTDGLYSGPYSFFDWGGLLPAY